MSDSDRYEARKVYRLRREGLVEESAPVVNELPVTIYLNGKEIITLLASDDALEYLAAGFLKGEGLLGERGDVQSISVDSSRTHVRVEAGGPDPLAERLLERRTVTSGCGKGTTFYHVLDSLQVKSAGPGPKVTVETIRSLMTRLHEASELYRAAGGVHNAALCDSEGIIIFRDDIGRHNAIDKIHGECFLEQIPADDKILVTTGRISSEILIKAGKLGVPVLVSRSGPTALALDLAERTGVTVVGRVRGGGLCVYSGFERVVA